MLAVQLPEPDHPVLGLDRVQIPDKCITRIGWAERQTAIFQAIGRLLQKAFLRRNGVKFVVLRHSCDGLKSESARG